MTCINQDKNAILHELNNVGNGAPFEYYDLLEVSNFASINLVANTSIDITTLNTLFSKGSEEWNKAMHIHLYLEDIDTILSSTYIQRGNDYPSVICFGEYGGNACSMKISISFNEEGEMVTGFISVEEV